MRWPSILTIVLFTAVAAACASRVSDVAPPASPIDLAVLTWNTHDGEGDLEGLLDDLTTGRLTTSAPRDVLVLLQEAVDEEGSLQRLADSRRLDLAYGVVRRRDDRHVGNAILSTRPLTDVRTIALPRQRQARGAVIASIDVEGVRLSVANVHLENRVSWWRGGLLSEGARRRQADALLREVPDGPAIAGGDLNTWLGLAEPAWRAFAARFPDTPPRPTPTFRDRLILDHVFFDLPDGWTASRLVVRERYGSDHHPVIGLVTRVR